MVERLFRGSRVTEKLYYKKFTPTVDWEWMLVVGILVGLSSRPTVGGIPCNLDSSNVGVFVRKRRRDEMDGGLDRGVLIGLGARWAGGCTSGHGISGTLQLAVSSWLAVMGFFIGGIVTAMAIFRFSEHREERSHVKGAS